MALDFCFLADREEALPTVAQWYFDHWGRHVEGETLADSEQRLQEYLHHQMPFIRLALLAGEVIGAAQLKFREMAELFPEREHWLGGVYIAAPHRGRGYGALMVEDIAALAPDHGVEWLYLQTEDLEGGIYAKLGWQARDRVSYNGVEVVVMRRWMGIATSESDSDAAV